LNGISLINEGAARFGQTDFAAAVIQVLAAKSVVDLWHEMAHISTVPVAKTKSIRSNRLVARISPDDKALLERAAILEGSSLASFVVSHVRTAAAEVIRQHETIQLNQAESERFLKALTAPPAKPTARMARALELYKQTVTER
jgi:uncharacterized protein (DUF1778 family)